MGRALLPVLSIIAGCSFAHGTNPVAGQPDAGAGGGSGTATAMCHVTDPAIRLCLDFEGNVVPIAVDLSSGYHDAAAVAVTPMPRGNQQAIELTSSSSVAVPEAADLDITTVLSMELWVSPSVVQDPTSYPVQNRGQYAVSFDNSGLIGCTIGASAVGDHQRSSLALGTFTHVGCTYDGAMLKLFVGGDVVSCQPAHGAIPTGNTTGTGIGAGKFLGGLDDVHVYARALSESEMCARAGRTGCVTACPAH